jgi:hypothetical protein
MGSWIETKRCSCRGDLNRFMIRSRRLVGGWEFSARLWSPLCWRCSNFMPMSRARGAVRAELIGDQDTRSAGRFAKELAKQAFGGASVATALNQSIEDKAVLIDGAPKPVLFAIDGDHDFIAAPLVTELRRAPAHFVGEVSPEFLSPAPDGFVTDDHTAGGQKIFDHS